MPCVAPAGAKRRMTRRIPAIATTARSNNITMFPNPAPKPRWLISAAMPSPAARPAIGPSHERFGATAGAAAVAGAVGCAAGGVGLAGAACGAARGGRLRCIPDMPPPPRRRAKASPGIEVAATRATASATMNDFMD
jgi:hypothetical protein